MGIPLWIYRKLQGNLQNRYSERMPNSYIKGKNVFLVARQKAKVHSLHSESLRNVDDGTMFFHFGKIRNEVLQKPNQNELPQEG